MKKRCSSCLSVCHQSTGPTEQGKDFGVCLLHLNPNPIHNTQQTIKHPWTKHFKHSFKVKKEEDPCWHTLLPKIHFCFSGICVVLELTGELVPFSYCFTGRGWLSHCHQLEVLVNLVVGSNVHLTLSEAEVQCHDQFDKQADTNWGTRWVYYGDAAAVFSCPGLVFTDSSGFKVVFFCLWPWDAIVEMYFCTRTEKFVFLRWQEEEPSVLARTFHTSQETHVQKSLEVLIGPPHCNTSCALQKQQYSDNGKDWLKEFLSEWGRGPFLLLSMFDGKEEERAVICVISGVGEEASQLF